jgi:hypothetical protein
MSLEKGEEPALPRAVWDALREDEPDPRDIERAYLRFTTPRARSVLPAGLWRWFAAGLVSGWGVVFAATGDPLFGAGLSPTPPPVDMPAPTEAPRAPARFPSRAPAVPPPDAAPSEGLTPPGTARGVSPDFDALRTPAATRSVAPAFDSALAPPDRLDPKWQRAARALKVRDYAEAESALLALVASGAPADREAASLSLAQVLVARGRSAEARVRLEQLKASARSPLVREKSSALLGEIFAPGGRSSEGAAATQSP